uniref:CCHC-type domain-containing protein n=1 Tax=Amphimedon queenslandica TaxID=400682 RepID=A0A1X7U2M8_AMPQE
MQVNTLIYSMGDEADDLLRSFKLTNAEAKNYATVRGKFEGFFVKRRNVIYERAKFNMRKQEEGETVAAFINDLYILVEHCEYAALQEEMIRDRLVVGLRDSKLSERLQLDSRLTLDSAITAVRQSESVQQQQRDIRKDEEKQLPVDSVEKRKKFVNRKRSSALQTKKPPQQSKCSRCGLSPNHEFKSCPARDSVCRGCNKRGHYQRVCKSAKVSDIHKESEKDDGIFLGLVTETQSKPWTVEVQVNGSNIEFCIDTGAEVTAVSERIHRLIGSPALQPLDKELKGPNDKRLDSPGLFEGHLQKGDYLVKQAIYVVRNLHRPLLGRPAIEKLHVLA